MWKRLVINIHGMTLTIKWLLVITVASSLLLCAPRAVADERLDQELVKEVAQGNVAAVMALLDRGADPNAKEKDDPGAPALMIAAFKGNVTVVSELVRRGADVNSRDKPESTVYFCYGASVWFRGTGSMSSRRQRDLKVGSGPATAQKVYSSP